MSDVAGAGRVRTRTVRDWVVDLSCFVTAVGAGLLLVVLNGIGMDEPGRSQHRTAAAGRDHRVSAGTIFRTSPDGHLATTGGPARSLR